MVISVPHTLKEVLDVLQRTRPNLRNDVKWFIKLYMKYKPGFDTRSAILISLATMGWFEQTVTGEDHSREMQF